MRIGIHPQSTLAFQLLVLNAYPLKKLFVDLLQMLLRISDESSTFLRSRAKFADSALEIVSFY
jgi:hypothetical protein